MERSTRGWLALAVSVGSAAAGIALATSLAQLLLSGIRTPDEAVAAGVQAVGLLIVGWYLLTALVALACVLVRTTGRAWAAGERRLQAHGAPLARRLLVSGAGAAVAAAAVLAPATAVPLEPTAPASESPSVIDDLGWGASAEDEPTTAPAEGTGTTDATGATDTTGSAGTTDPTSEPSATASAGEGAADPAQTPSSDPAADPTDDADGGGTGPTGSTATTGGDAPAAPAADETAPSDGPGTTEGGYAVVAGDSLWSISAAHLPPDATTAQIDASWPLWFEANRDVVGSDPDLIHPGQVLIAPVQLTEEDS